MKIKLGILVFVSLISLLGVTACDLGEEDKALDSTAMLQVKITDQPQGGQNITRVSCTLSAQINGMGAVDAFPPPAPTLTVWWTNDKGATYNKETHSFPIGINESRNEVFTTSFSPSQPGQVLDKTFWVKYTISDSFGSKTHESEKAVCTVK